MSESVTPFRRFFRARAWRRSLGVSPTVTAFLVGMSMVGMSLAAAPAGAVPPDEGECPTLSGRPEPGEVVEDAQPIVLKEGMVIDRQSILALRSLLPVEIWQHREVFFHEGMRMVIGPCHRRYAIPNFQRAATEAFAGKPRLDRNNDLERYTAGTPFPPETIDPDAKDAAARWAWNLERRYRGAGHRGKFRITSFPSSVGATQVYTGDFELLEVSGRADHAKDGYALPDIEDVMWSLSGRFREPFNARDLAWRQVRKKEAFEDWDVADDVFVYVPTMRKMRRGATPWVLGAYVPRFLVAGDSAGGGLAIGGGSSINPTAGRSIAVSEDGHKGFTGLHIRPNAFGWRLRGEQTVIAPLNGNQYGYPQNPDRNYGVSGMSVASDRWDVRHAVVIEGAIREPSEALRVLTLYVDYQTQQPLYWISRTGKRRLMEIGIFVHRYTGDMADYPEWPGGVPTLVFEPVATVFFDALAGQGGWMRESYDMVSLPFSAGDQRRLTSMDDLQRGH